MIKENLYDRSLILVNNCGPSYKWLDLQKVIKIEWQKQL